MQRVLSWFAPNLAEGWGRVQGRTHQVVAWIQDFLFKSLSLTLQEGGGIFPHFHQYLALLEVCALLRPCGNYEHKYTHSGYWYVWKSSKYNCILMCYLQKLIWDNFRVSRQSCTHKKLMSVEINQLYWSATKETTHSFVSRFLTSTKTPLRDDLFSNTVILVCFLPPASMHISLKTWLGNLSVIGQCPIYRVPLGRLSLLCPFSFPASFS